MGTGRVTLLPGYPQVTAYRGKLSTGLERRYVADLERAHGLPAGRRQVQRKLASGTRYLDNLYERFHLCVELDGQSSHPPEQKWHDADRDNDNLLHDGVQTVRFGLRDVTARRCERLS